MSFLFLSSFLSSFSLPRPLLPFLTFSTRFLVPSGLRLSGARDGTQVFLRAGQQSLDAEFNLSSGRLLQVPSTAITYLCCRSW